MRPLAALLLFGPACTGGVPWEPPEELADGDGAAQLAPEGPPVAEPPETASPPAEAPPPAVDEPPAADPPDDEPAPDPPTPPDDGPIIPLPPEAELGDEPGDALPLEVGAPRDGEIADGDAAQYWRVDVEGPWRIDVRFRHDAGDLDVYVWDVAGSRPKTDRSGRPIGSESDDDNEEFVFRRPAVVRVQGWQGATNRYRIALTRL